jgi:hypothetical protein
MAILVMVWLNVVVYIRREQTNDAVRKALLLQRYTWSDVHTEHKKNNNT